jgi:hypothetical protein
MLPLTWCSGFPKWGPFAILFTFAQNLLYFVHICAESPLFCSKRLQCATTLYVQTKFELKILTQSRYLARRFCTNVNKIARGPHLGNPEHHVRGNICLLLDVCWSKVCSFSVSGLNLYLRFASMVFLTVFMNWHSSPLGICYREVCYFVLLPLICIWRSWPIPYFYIMPSGSHVPRTACECLSRFRPKLWNTMGIAGNVLPHRISTIYRWMKSFPHPLKGCFADKVIPLNYMFHLRIPQISAPHSHLAEITTIVAELAKLM